MPPFAVLSPGSSLLVAIVVSERWTFRCWKCCLIRCSGSASRRRPRSRPSQVINHWLTLVQHVCACVRVRACACVPVRAVCVSVVSCAIGPLNSKDTLKNTQSTYQGKLNTLTSSFYTLLLNSIHSVQTYWTAPSPHSQKQKKEKSTKPPARI